MSSAYRFKLAAQRIADLVYMLLPRPRPSRVAAAACRIVSHRGEHDNRETPENTLAAFDAAVAGGAWGIELDLRWTRDYVPVVIHDTDTRRVFGSDLVVHASRFDELRARVPQIPTLAEVVERYGGSYHLMIELKRDLLTDTARKRDCLRALLDGLRPVTDFHILALEPGLFAAADFAGDAACMPVAELNYRQLSRETLARPFAGISGPYALMNARLLASHHAAGQKVGTGFVASRFCLYREMRRGVDWIFTNHAVKLAEIRRRLLDAPARRG